MKRQNPLRTSQKVSWPLLVALNLLLVQPAAALPYELSYLGRLTDTSGMPISGPIDLELKFYRSETGSDLVAITPPRFNALNLADGVFQVNITLSPSDFHTLFPDSSAQVFVEVTNLTHGRTYKRQKYNTVPYALKVPVDGTTVSYTSDGKLSVKGLKGASLPNTVPSDGQVLKWRTATGWEWGNDETGGAASTVTSTQIVDGTIVNADIATSAAIAGSKIVPNFGSQVIYGDGSGLTNLPSGTLGTTIDSAEIVDGTITDADVSSTAAISQSKISGLAGTLAAKEAAFSAGTATQYLRGDKSWATLDTAAIPENGNLYFTEARARAVITATSPLQYNSATGNLSMNAATSVSAGYLSSSDWLTFNGKQEPISASTTLTAGKLSTAMQAGVEIKPYGPGAGQLGELRFYELSGPDFVGFRAPDVLSATRIWTLPAYDGVNGQVLSTDGSGSLSWITPGGGGGGSGTVTGITAGTGLTGGTITGSGTISLANTAVIAGTYTRPMISVDAQGRITNATSGTNIDLAADVTGTLSLANGGTGSSTASGARTNLGLGTLATLNTITDAHIDGAAAINQSKISGLSTALSGKQATLTVNTPLNLAGSTLTIANANASNAGVLSASDWNTFNSKQSALSPSSSIDLNNLTLRPMSGVPGEVRFVDSSNTNAVVLRAPASLPSNVILNLPASSGGPGQVLSNDGAGNMRWGGDLRLGNGDNTSSPASQSIIQGATALSGTPNTIGSDLIVAAGNGTGSSPSGRIIFQTAAAGTSGSTPNTLLPRMVVQSTGNVGIGTTAPSNTLHVFGSLCVKNTACTGSTAGMIYASSSTISTADLAENMPIAPGSQLAAGDLVRIVSGTGEQAVFAPTTEAFQASAAGVVSTKPGITLGSETKDSLPVALAGRVPVNVTLEGGPIRVGDLLVPSSAPGKAMRAKGPGVPGVIGVALSAYDGEPIPARDYEDGIAHESGHQVMLFVQVGAGSGAAVHELKQELEKARLKYDRLKTFLCQKFEDAPDCQP